MTKTKAETVRLIEVRVRYLANGRRSEPDTSVIHVPADHWLAVQLITTPARAVNVYETGGTVRTYRLSQREEQGS